MAASHHKKPQVYHLYEEMRRLADALHTFAQELRDQGATDQAIECYREARELAEVCAKLEKAPVGRTLDATQGVLMRLNNRFALSEAKRRQHTDTLIVAGPTANGGGGPTEEETHDDE